MRVEWDLLTIPSILSTDYKRPSSEHETKSQRDNARYADLV